MLSTASSTCTAESPSSRRAWIEIGIHRLSLLAHYVALLAEGVDRNIMGMNMVMAVPPSPSSRRAWIEIYLD